MSSYHLHDMMFKETFSNPAMTLALMKKVLPEKAMASIEPGSLKPSKDSFVSKQNTELFADLVFDVKMINNKKVKIYLLFEHKRHHDEKASLQLLSYMTEIWRKQVKEKKSQLSPIIPILIAQKKTPWQGKTEFAQDMFGEEVLENNEPLRPFIPTFEFLLFDFKADHVAKAIQAIENKMERLSFEVFRMIDEENMTKLEEKLIELVTIESIRQSSASHEEWLSRMLYYVLNGNSHLKPENFVDMTRRLETTDPERSEWLMTLAEHLRQEGMEKGMEKGLEKGILKGIQKGELNKALIMFRKLQERGESKETIMDLLDINEEIYNEYIEMTNS